MDFSYGNLQIELKSATELVSPRKRTTAKTIRQRLDQGKYPLYFNTYNSNYSFVAVPPEFLVELAKKAGEKEFAQEVSNKLQETKTFKEKIIQDLRENYKKRKEGQILQ